MTGAFNSQQSSTYSDFAFTLVNMISTSIVVRFLSSSLRSRVSLANLEPSIRGAAPFAPNAQNDLNTSSMSEMKELQNDH